MTLRTRLVAAFTVMLLVTISALSLMAARSSRSALLAQIDEDVRGIELRISQRAGVGLRPGPAAEATVAHSFAYLLLDDTGAIVVAGPSGFADEPDPLPGVADLAALLAAPGQIATVAAFDDSIDYRAVAILSDDGGFQVGAVPIDDVDSAVGQLVLWLIAGGATLVAVGGLATWLTVRRGLRPVDTMVDTAAAIAQGDLTRRVPEHDPATELGRLGTALNDMLTQLDVAFAHERESQQRLNQFVADASHELRTPLAALQGYADLYRKGALEDPADLDNAMRRIRKESARMQRLVDDLLLLARLDRGQPLNVTTIDLVAVIRDTIADSQAIDPDRPVTYEGPRSATVAGDEQRLAQVFANLLANGRAHTPPGTHIGIGVETKPNDVSIDFIDDGPGIAADQFDTLFDRFHRGDTSRSRQTAGSGLGLSIVAAIVEAHGGAVSAANEPGHGARFTVSLPARADSASGAQRVGGR